METKLGKIKKMVLGPTAREKGGRVGWGEEVLSDSKAFVLNYCSLQQSFPLPHALVLVEKGGGEPGKTTGLAKKFVHAFLYAVREKSEQTFWRIG